MQYDETKPVNHDMVKKALSERKHRKMLIGTGSSKQPLDLCDHILDKARAFLLNGEIKVKGICSVCGKELIF